MDATIAELSRRQRGRVGRRQLLSAGASPDAITRRIRRRQLLPVYPGVYATGHRSKDRIANLWAAWLYAGEDAAFSHQVGAELWEAPVTSSSLITLTAPRRVRRQPGLRAYRSELPPDELTRKHGLPVTTISRVVLDLAPVLPARRLERLLEELHRREIGDRLGLEGILARHPGRRGAGRLRRVLETWEPGASWTRSELEERFIPFLDAHAIPRGTANAYVKTPRGWFECDHVWRRERLVVELDGVPDHTGDRAIERDSAKRRALVAAGWQVVVVTWRQLHDEPEVLAAELRTLLGARPTPRRPRRARRRARRAPPG